MGNVYPQRNNKNTLRLIVIVFCLIALLNRSASQPVLSFTQIVSGLDQPMQLVNAGDGTNRIFVAHRDGTINVYNQSITLIGTFLTISGISTVDERGLLSMAFHPDYEMNGFFYVYYTNTDGSLELARYHATGISNTAESGSKAVVLNIPHPFSIHNGGTIHFGSDGYLYLTTGDGGDGQIPSKAQDGTSLLGKMLRIAVNTSLVSPFYSIPASNPYAGNDGIADEIWSFGLRNPFRWSFDRSNGDMWITDVGEDDWEEINFSAANATGPINYGWQCYEGNAQWDLTGCTSGYTSPTYVYANTGTASVMGGTVYRGTTVPANAPLRGYYLAADYFTGNIYKIKPNGSGWTTYFQTDVLRKIVNFGEAENGELYAVTLNTSSSVPFSGSIYEITVSAVLPVTLVEFTANSNNRVVQLNWKTSSEQNLQQFEIEYGIDGNSFMRTGIVPAANNAGGSEYTFSHEPPSSGRIFYRLKMIDFDGQFRYSGIIITNIDKPNKNFVQPSIITSGVINVFLNNSFNTLELINMSGAVLLKQNIKGRIGKIDIPIPFVTTGTYMVQVRNNETTLKQLILIRK